MEVWQCQFWSHFCKVHWKWWLMEFILKRPIFGHSELCYGRSLKEKSRIWECPIQKWLRKFREDIVSQDPISAPSHCTIKLCMLVGSKVEILRLNNLLDPLKRPDFEGIYVTLCDYVPDDNGEADDLKKPAKKLLEVPGRGSVEVNEYQVRNEQFYTGGKAEKDEFYSSWSCIQNKMNLCIWRNALWYYSCYQPRGQVSQVSTCSFLAFRT